MKEFNINAAKRGAKLCTREGLSARIICRDKSGMFPIVALVKNAHGVETVTEYREDGKWGYGGLANRFDLMINEGSVKGWVNIFLWEDNKITTSQFYLKREEAEANADLDPCVKVATVEVEF